MCPIHLLNLVALAGLLKRIFLFAECVELVAYKLELPGENLPQGELMERKQNSEIKEADDIT